MENEAMEKAQIYIDEYMKRAEEAQILFEKMSQAEVDRAVMVIGKVVYDNAELLAELAVEETGMGNVPDKISKNKSKAKMIWHSLKGKKSRGILSRDDLTGITEIAKPMGVAAAITPCTNPIVTPMSNAMFALKCGNSIIITPHHKAVKSSGLTVEMMRGELKKVGIPENLIQILDAQSRENTRALISSADVVIATGGMGMVKAAYSSGRPALGVGAGNVQSIIDRNVNLEDAVGKIVTGRAYDNGIICSGEQSIIYPEEMREELEKELEKCGAYVMKKQEDKAALRKVVFDEKGAMNRHAVGQSASDVAKLADISIPKNTKVIMIEADGPGNADLFSKEKICPILAAYPYKNFEDAVEIAKKNLESEGKGHSVAIHSNDRGNIEFAGKELSVSRFVVNQMCAGSAGGSFYNGLNPTNTLGCGSWGRNSISENLTYKHLMNVSRIALFMPENHVPSDEELWKL